VRGMTVAQREVGSWAGPANALGMGQVDEARLRGGGERHAISVGGAYSARFGVHRHLAAVFHHGVDREAAKPMVIRAASATPSALASVCNSQLINTSWEGLRL